MYLQQSFIVKNYKEIKKAERLIEDKESRELYRHYINFISFKWKIPKRYEAKYNENVNPAVLPQKGDTVIDAGIGTYNGEACYPLILYAEMVGEKGFVYGFEINKIFMNEINKSVKNSNLKNIKVFPLGVWSENAKTKIYSCDQSSSILVPCSDEILDAEVVSLDSFIKDNKIGKIDFIKLDVEGAEMDALKGALNTIRQDKPKLVVSLYHRPEDIFNIISYIHFLNPNYTMYIGYHYPFDYPDGFENKRNLMLYALDKTKNERN